MEELDFFFIIVLDKESVRSIFEGYPGYENSQRSTRKQAYWVSFSRGKKEFLLPGRNQQDGNVPSRRHILGSKIFKEQLLEKFGKKIFSKKNF